VGSAARDGAAGWELHFRPLVDGACGCTVPCDADGRVDLDALGDQTRRHYLYARALVGGRYARPVIRPAD
jgi:hypothetical protein